MIFLYLQNCECCMPSCAKACYKCRYFFLHWFVISLYIICVHMFLNHAFGVHCNTSWAHMVHSIRSKKGTVCNVEFIIFVNIALPVQKNDTECRVLHLLFLCKFYPMGQLPHLVLF